MRNIAIIPARSGSKGLKDKNIRELDGKPLLGYSILAARESGMFSDIMVSTDSERYAEIAVKQGAEVPFLRSDENSGSLAGSWDVVREVLEKYRDQGEQFHSVCLLQPTSPLRKAEDIINCYKLLEIQNANAITSVCEVEHSPLWTMRLPEDTSLDAYRKSFAEKPRQLLDTYYRFNGAIYIRKVEYLEDDIVIRHDCEYAYIMERRRSVDIDTIEDFEYAEFLLKR